MTRDEFVEFARKRGLDMVQIFTLLDVREDRQDFHDWADRIDTPQTYGGDWFTVPQLGQPGAFVDRKGNVWSVPFEKHDTFGIMLGLDRGSDDLRYAGWLHISNFQQVDPEAQVTGDCYGKPMTRAQERTAERLWPRFKFDESDWRGPARPIADDQRELIADIERRYGRIKRLMAAETKEAA